MPVPSPSRESVSISTLIVGYSSNYRIFLSENFTLCSACLNSLLPLSCWPFSFTSSLRYWIKFPSPGAFKVLFFHTDPFSDWLGGSSPCLTSCGLFYFLFFSKWHKNRVFVCLFVCLMDTFLNWKWCHMPLVSELWRRKRESCESKSV